MSAPAVSNTATLAGRGEDWIANANAPRKRQVAMFNTEPFEPIPWHETRREHDLGQTYVLPVGQYS